VIESKVVNLRKHGGYKDPLALLRISEHKLGIADSDYRYKRSGLSPVTSSPDPVLPKITMERDKRIGGRGTFFS
jgi:hypothetical protein